MEYNLSNDAERWKAEQLRSVEFSERKRGGEQIGAVGEKTETSDPERMTNEAQGAEIFGNALNGSEQGMMSGAEQQANSVGEQKRNPLTVWAEGMPTDENLTNTGEIGEGGGNGGVGNTAGQMGAIGAVPNFGAMPPGVGDTVSETAALSTEMSSKKMKRMAGETITREYADKLREAEKRDADDPFTMANNYVKEQAEAFAEGFFADGYQLGDGN